jgi:hypothetical protein
MGVTTTVVPRAQVNDWPAFPADLGQFQIKLASTRPAASDPEREYNIQESRSVRRMWHGRAQLCRASVQIRSERRGR